MAENMLLTCRGLSFSYQKDKILDGIDLDFEKGEFIALLGRNGAGKSTLLSCLSGLYSAEYKSLELGDIRLQDAGRREIAKRISFVPQEHEDIFPYTVAEVVVMGRTVFLGTFGAPQAIDFEKTDEVLQELHISHLKERIYTTLSGGEKQLVLLARALVQSRNLIFLDEPTNHLDYKNRYHMLATLKKLRDKDESCIVACLHDPNHALLFADKVLLLEQGKIVAQGPTKEVLTAEAVSRLYGIATIKEKSAHMECIHPSFIHSSFASKVLLLVGASGEGKTSLLQKCIESQPRTSFGGIINPGTWKNNRRHSSTAHCLTTGEKTLFCKRPQDDAPFTFYPEGMELAERALSVACNRNNECIVVDEVGPLELNGKGYAPHLPSLLSLETPKHIWAVRPSIVEQVCNKWMLVDPVIVSVTDTDALRKVQQFIQGNL